MLWQIRWTTGIEYIFKKIDNRVVTDWHHMTVWPTCHVCRSTFKAREKAKDSVTDGRVGRHAAELWRQKEKEKSNEKASRYHYGL